MKYFRRAIRADEEFAYAYTLCGLELFTNEEYDEAITCFRQAMQRDPRHFNAWSDCNSNSDLSNQFVCNTSSICVRVCRYGLGTVYHRQQSQGLAEYHFRKAISINPYNTVLYVYLGIVLLAQVNDLQGDKREKVLQKALSALQRASDLDPTNPLANLHRARVYSAMGHYHEALLELRVAQDSAPKEILIYTQMANACKMLAQQPNISDDERREWLDEAVRHFTSAVDLDPKESNAIKSQIQELQQEFDAV